MLSFLTAPAHAREPMVMVQLFNWTFREVENALPALAESGYTHVQISPVQKSLENGKWWGRYQPIDYREIDGPLGSREEFVAMTARAREQGIQVIVDVVLNHMAANRMEFPDFGKEDFHKRRPIRDWDDVEEVRNGWLFGALPDLKTESPRVRAKLAAHLRDLRECGADGFRVDSARHIPPEDLQAILELAGDVGWVVGEIAHEEKETFESHLAGCREMDFYDFPALARLVEVLKGKREIGDLAKDEGLPADRSVRFVRNHDIDRGQAEAEVGIGGEAFLVDAGFQQFAHCWLFGSEGGVPCVYVDDPKLRDDALPEETFDRDFIKSGIAFHRAVSGLPQEVVKATRDWVAWRRGGEALVVLNRSKTDLKLKELACGLEDGSYYDVYSSREFEVSDGKVHGIEVGARSGVGLLKR